MNQENISDNNVNGAGTCIGEGPSFGRYPVDEQRRSGRYPATANQRGERINWRPFNKVVMECYYEGEPERRGFMKRMRRNRAEQWYNHKPEGVSQNESVKVLWDFNVNTDNEIEHRRPDIVVELKAEKECLIIDIAVPGDTRIKQKEQEKIGKYQDLKREIARLWRLRKVSVIPVVVGALGCVTKEAEHYVEKIGIKIRTEVIQTTALLGTARTLRKVLET